MVGVNGINGSRGAKPMEIEAMMPLQTSVGPPPHFMDRALHLIKLYIEHYPKIATLIFFSIIGFAMYLIAPNFKAPIVRNRLHHDYANISSHYNFRASQIDHWCLWGGDHDCKCLDFTEPESRENVKGWLKAHEHNKEKVQQANKKGVDIVFVGDEMVERLNGERMGQPSSSKESQQIAEMFNRTFYNADNQFSFEPLALGISGDSTSNLLWRLQHGEMTQNLGSNIYWLWIGMNDLIDGYCSEEAVVLGILRTAEELSWHDPDAVVVVQGILPLSTHGGDLQAQTSHKLFRHPKAVHSVAKAKDKYFFWPSIEAINDELAKFCANHPKMVYFDAGKLFIGSLGNDHFRQKSLHIMQDLMPDFIHPSLTGYRVLLNAIKEEVERILLEDDETNDIEEKSNGRP